MKREIKFRGINEIHNSWVYGYLIKDKDDKSILVRVEKINRTAPDGGFDFNVPRELATVVKTKTVGQYIGLKGRNEREIYEGDIIDAYYSYSYGNYGQRDFKIIRGVVEYTQGQFAINIGKTKAGATRYLYFNQISIPDSEIVGNIYENTELLKEKEKEKEIKRN